MEEALANRTDVVLRIDVQGAATVRAIMPETLSIFLVRLCPRNPARLSARSSRLCRASASHPVRIHRLPAKGRTGAEVTLGVGSA